MSIHDLDGYHSSARAVTTMPIARRPDTDPQMDEDMRRLCLSMLALLKRRYPKDWRRVALELFDAKAA
jgi:hypothetical protein